MIRRLLALLAALLLAAAGGCVVTNPRPANQDDLGCSRTPGIYQACQPDGKPVPWW